MAFEGHRRHGAGGLGSHVSGIERLEVQLEGTGPVREQRVIDERRDVHDLTSMSSRASPTSATRWCGTTEVVTLARMTVSGTQLVAGIGRELALPTEGVDAPAITSRIGTSARPA
jgi:hypothetical protein